MRRDQEIQVQAHHVDELLFTGDRYIQQIKLASGLTASVHGNVALIHKGERTRSSAHAAMAGRRFFVTGNENTMNRC
jgi:hypothetical protein